MAVDDVLAAVADWKSRINEISLYRDYYDGKHRIGQYASDAFRRDFLWILQNSRENLCKAVVRGFSSKMRIQGWESNTSVSSEVASEIQDALGLQRVYNLTHREAFRTGDSYILVWPDAAGTLRPWPKLSSQCVPKPSATDPDDLDWMAMIWLTTDGYGRVNLYYPERLERWVTQPQIRQASNQPHDPVYWPDKPTGYVPFDGDGEGDVIVNAAPGRVPWVWFPHDADELGQHGRSILQDVVPLQDALNKSVADMIVGGENYAFPLRYLLNFRAKRTIDPGTGEVKVEDIKANPNKNRFLAVPGNGPIGQLDPPDASKIIAVHQEYAAKISRVVGLPAFYVSQTQGEPPTGASLRVLSTRLTNLSTENMDDWTPRWSRMWELLGVPDVRPLWKDPAPVDESEELENAEARKRIGFGLLENLKELGYDDDDAQRIADDVAQQAVTNARAFEGGFPPAELTT